MEFQTTWERQSIKKWQWDNSSIIITEGLMVSLYFTWLIPFPADLVVKNLLANAGDAVLIPG